MKSKWILTTFIVLMSFTLLSGTVMATIGSGELDAYSDPYSTLLPTDSNAGGSWSVLVGQTIYIQIKGITDYALTDPPIYVYVKWTDTAGGTGSHIATLGPVPVETLSLGVLGVGTDTHPLAWVVGEFDDGTYSIPYCNTMVVAYGTHGNNAGNALAGGSQPGHLHVIPEYLYGGLAAMGACFVGFAAFKSRSSIRIKLHK